ncbi:YidB family protein [Acinetobacter sp. A3.8]|uniref:YidB family protein n=1 Tax=Acinetobacter sedimenti TaxID=2919922 RepID=A0A9X1WX53_9GAMM|nr:YidB family protein [Acinetobacter sedimenti]MCJ8146779.1 YidB family protein [Acinetobacter sedimenti]
MTNLASLVEAIAKQALGGQTGAGQQQSTTQNHQNTQQNANNAGGLGSILGSVLGNLGGASQQNANNAGGLGSILGSVLGQLGGTQGRTGGGGKSGLLIAVLPIVLAWIQKQGGLQGALDKLTKSGLGSQAQSWVDPSTAQNQSVQTEQVQQLFDEQDIAQVANQTNEPTQNVYAAIATVLPQIIDSLTPQGQTSNSGEANNDIQNILNSLNIK